MNRTYAVHRRSGGVWAGAARPNTPQPAQLRNSYPFKFGYVTEEFSILVGNWFCLCICLVDRNLWSIFSIGDDNFGRVSLCVKDKLEFNIFV